MEDALVALPTSLHEAFSETISRIQRQPEGRRRLAMNTLLWISHARRPLEVDELSEALAIRSGQSSLNPRYRPTQKLMIECCMGLVVLDEQSKSIRLVHYTVQEYFRGIQKEIFPSGDEEVVEKCLTYLLFDQFKWGCCPNGTSIARRITSHRFLVYAATEWGHHARESQCRRIDDLMLKFLHSQPHRAASIQVHRWSRGYRKRYWEPVEVNSATALLTTCFFGLEHAAEALLVSGEGQVNVTTHMGTTPVIRAAATGHPRLVRMLLDRGADPTLANWYGNALSCAAEAGHCNTIQELLDFGIDINLRDAYGRTALHCAATNGHEDALKLMIEHGADIEALDRNGEMLWHILALEGHIRAMRFLLDKGFDPETKCKNGMTALHCAASQGHTKVIRMLIDQGVDVNVRDNSGFIASYYAVYLGNAKAEAMLLEAGANIDEDDDDRMSALFQAAPRVHDFYDSDWTDHCDHSDHSEEVEELGVAGGR